MEHKNLPNASHKKDRDPLMNPQIVSCEWSLNACAVWLAICPLLTQSITRKVVLVFLGQVAEKFDV